MRLTADVKMHRSVGRQRVCAMCAHRAQTGDESSATCRSSAVLRQTVEYLDDLFDFSGPLTDTPSRYNSSWVVRGAAPCSSFQQAKAMLIDPGAPHMEDHFADLGRDLIEEYIRRQGHVPDVCGPQVGRGGVAGTPQARPPQMISGQCLFTARVATAGWIARE